MDIMVVPGLVEYVDLPTGHWPQFSRPEDLAGAILASIDGAARREPPGGPSPSPRGPAS